MNNSAKNSKRVALVIAVVLIIAAIWYLESQKPHPTGTVQDISSQVVAENQANESASSTTASQNKNSNAQNSPNTIAQTTPATNNRAAILKTKALEYPRAKELVDPTGFINTQPFKLSDLAGKKVVLIDFWTYSCINCIRTLPYLNAWYQKYKDYGLVIVGVHTPEFDFEKNYDNVSKAVQQFGVKYPVVLDSDNGTWNAYQNLYWPHEYLIDIDGFVVHDKIGEGDYDKTEEAIQKALQERSDVLGLGLKVPTTITTPADVINMDSNGVQSPETYFGSYRNEYLGNGTQVVSGVQNLVLPTMLQNNTLYLDGSWNFLSQYAESTGQTAKIVFKYNSKNVYFVASSPNPNGVTIKIYKDGTLVNTQVIKDNKLYTLIQGTDYGVHTLEIDVEGAGLDAYTFTFG